ncbi:[protein-PII] uridylyltransferase [Fundidesulfovibrio butyratiphilus]
MTHTPSKAATDLAKARKILTRDFELDTLPADFSQRHAQLFDRYFADRLDECPELAGQAAVVAVGGYGRSELCLRSDIDVLLVYSEGIPDQGKELAKALFFPLWDLNVDLGHGARSVSECLELAGTDFQVLASLLDARLLCGDRKAFDDFQRRLSEFLTHTVVQDFKTWLEAQNQRRATVYGDASGLLEPNLKEGLGGLRDAHQIRWLTGLTQDPEQALPAAEAEVLADHMVFLLTVRNHLHHMLGRKDDRLDIDVQPALAERLHFEGAGDVLPVEAFLAELQRRMAEIRLMRESSWPMLASAQNWRAAPSLPLDGCVRLTSLGLDFAPGWEPEDNPLSVLDIFGHALRVSVHLSLAARRKVEAGAQALARSCQTPEGGRRAFDFLITALSGAGGESALTDMLETGVFDAVVPGFSRVRHMMQYDVYHVHPVGRHTLETILEIKKAAKSGHPYHDIYTRVPHPERLYLGALFHDIGKGLGGSHAQKGAALATSVLTGLGLDRDLVSDVNFLVLWHLTLMETALRRDLSDKDVLARCAARVGTTARLDMLLLLTVGDSLATGPSAWNSWRAGLVGELYIKVRRVLEGGGLFDASDAQTMLAARDKVRARVRAEGETDPKRLETLLDAMPPRYLITRPVRDILGDLKMLKELEAVLEDDRRQRPSDRAGLGVAVIETKPAPGGGWLVTLVAKHNPELFSTMAGVLALHGINIYSADFSLWNDGTEIHFYQTAEPPDTLYIDEVWARVRRAVRYALTGKLSLDYRIKEKRASPLTAKTPDMGAEPLVNINDASSEYYTLVEVTGPDRMGLLYDVAKALEELELQVHMAKINTPGATVHDVFFVRDASGAKLTDSDFKRHVADLLLARLAEG